MRDFIYDDPYQKTDGHYKICGFIGLAILIFAMVAQGIRDKFYYLSIGDYWIIWVSVYFCFFASYWERRNPQVIKTVSFVFLTFFFMQILAAIIGIVFLGEMNEVWSLALGNVYGARAFYFTKGLINSGFESKNFLVTIAKYLSMIFNLYMGVHTLTKSNKNTFVY